MKFQSFIKYFDWLEERTVEQEKATEKEMTDGETKTDDSGGDGVDKVGDSGDVSGGDGECGGQTTTASLNDANAKNTIKISRKVFSGKQWLTIEDWLECTQSLCRLEIKHEGRIERSHDECVQTIFASPRLGGNILSNGWSQVRVYCRFFFTFFRFFLAFFLQIFHLSFVRLLSPCETMRRTYFMENVV